VTLSLTEQEDPMATATLHVPLVLFRMTSDEFCELPPSDTVKLELLNGEVVVMTRPTPHHQHFVFELGMAIQLWSKPRKLGRVLPDVLLKLDDNWTPAPDLVFVARKHLRRVREKRIEGLVDLAVEVLSPNKPEIDLETKFTAYARFGILWYWIVDLKKRILHEYGLANGIYGNLVRVPFDEPFKPRLFRGLAIDLASLEW
jgi:Uma2 family endonuclease